MSKTKISFTLCLLGSLVWEIVICEPNITLSCPSTNDVPQITILNAKNLVLQCKAAYPIEWEFIGNGPNILKIVGEVISQDYYKNSSKCYTTTLNYWNQFLLYSNDERRTGNYTCRSLNDYGKVNSIYNFILGKSQNLFNVRNRFISKAVMKKNNEYFIPCPSNVERIIPSIVKEDEDHIWKPIPTNFYRYDPKFGFFLNASYILNPGGKYNCIGKVGSVTDTVDVQLRIMDETFAVSPQVEYLSFGNGEKTIALTCESVEEVYFGFGKSQDMKIIERPGTNDSNPLRFYVTANLTLTNNQAKGDIFCAKRLSAGSVLHTWKYDASKSCNCIWNASVSNQNFGFARGEIVCSNEAGYETKLEFLPCNNPTECRMTASCIADDDCQKFQGKFRGSNGTSFYDSSLTSSSIKCSVGEYTHAFSAFSNLNSLYFGAPPLVGNLVIMTLESSMFQGDMVSFKCVGAKYRFMEGFKWALRFKNGTLRPVLNAVSASKSFIRNSYFEVIRTLIEITSKDIESVFCFAPVWNSNEWENVSLPLTIEGPDPIENLENQKCSKLSETPIILMDRSRSIESEFLGFLKPKDFRSKTLWYNVTSSDLVLPRYITLICMARYPVQWTFEEKIRPHWNDSKVVNEPHAEDKQKSVFCFESKVFITYMQQNTGNYTCQVINKPHVQASTYIYMNAERHGIPLIKHGTYISIEFNQTYEWTTLPCRVSQPTITPQLYEQDLEGQFQLIKEGGEIKYNPKKGFQIKSSSIDATKIYICSTQRNQTSHSITFLLRKPETPKINPTDIVEKSEVSADVEKYRCLVGNKYPILISRGYKYINSTYKLQQTSFENLTNLDTVIREPISLLRVSCLAIYPIVWLLDGKKIYFKTEMIEDENQGKEMTKSLCFRASLEVLHSDDSRSTGNYTCQKADDRSVQSSAYIYSYGDGKYPLLNHGEHKELEVDQVKQFTIIPCRVSYPNASVLLYQGNNNNRFNLVGDAKYNPKEGFSIKTSSLSASSLYLCSTQANDSSHSISYKIIMKKEYNNKKGEEKSTSNFQTEKLYIVAIIGSILILALVLSLLFMYRELKIQKELVKTAVGSRSSLDRNPSFMMSDLLNQASVEAPARSYERF